MKPIELCQYARPFRCAWLVGFIMRPRLACLMSRIVSWYKYPQVHYNKFFTVVSTGAVYTTPLNRPSYAATTAAPEVPQAKGPLSFVNPALSCCKGPTAADKDRLNASHYWLLLSSAVVADFTSHSKSWTRVTVLRTSNRKCFQMFFNKKTEVRFLLNKLHQFLCGFFCLEPNEHEPAERSCPDSGWETPTLSTGPFKDCWNNLPHATSMLPIPPLKHVRLHNYKDSCNLLPF